MHRKEDSHKDVHRDNYSHIVKVSIRLQGIDTDEDDSKYVVDDTMIDRSDTALKGAEGEEFLSGPDLINAIRILNFFLLHSLLVELCRDLVPVYVTEQLHVVEDGH